MDDEWQNKRNKLWFIVSFFIMLQNWFGEFDFFSANPLMRIEATEYIWQLEQEMEHKIQYQNNFMEKLQHREKKTNK